MKPAPWRNSKKIDEGIAESTSPYGHPLYHVKIKSPIEGYPVPEAVIDEIEQRCKEAMNKGGHLITDANVEITTLNPIGWQEFIGVNVEISELGMTCIGAEVECNPYFTPFNRPPEAWRDGFHVSVLDPYPEGA